MEKPERENFNLVKLKTPKEGGLKVDWKYNQSIRGEIHEFNDHVKTTVEPHPDLTAQIRSLKDYFMRITYLSFFHKVINREQFEASESQRKIADSSLDELKRYVRITGISLSGTGDSFGVVINGVIDAETGQGMALNTHRIKLQDEVYGFEGEILDVIEDIETECYQYIYEGKMASPDLFQDVVETPGESDETESEDEEHNSEE